MFVNSDWNGDQDDIESTMAAIFTMPMYDEDGVEIPEEELPWNGVSAEHSETENEDDASWEDDETAEMEILPTYVHTRPAAERRKRISQSVREESLRRMELSTRTVSEFQELSAWYDREEQSRMRRERRYETLRGDIPLESGALPDGDILPRSMSQPTFRQICWGEFDDYLNTCLFEMHNLMEREHLRTIVEELKIDHKEVLFFLGIRLYPTQLLAELRGQSERNIRKVRNTVQRRIHKQLYGALIDLQKTNADLIHLEQTFLRDYTPTQRRRVSNDQSV